MSLAQLAVLTGAAYGFLGVAFGAFGAHALKAKLSVEMLSAWKTAVEYQLYHALALMIVGLIATQRPSIAITNAGICFALGVLLFSGSLYVMALSGVRWLGAVTPLGGLLLLIGWALLFWAALKHG